MFKSICRRFKSIDTFGQEIKLSFRGEATSQTYAGAVATFLLYFLIIYYLALQLKAVFLQEYALNRTMKIENIIFQSEAYNLKEDNFSFAVAVKS